MPTPRYGLAGGVVNSRIYAVGGAAEDPLSFAEIIYSAVEAYDPPTDSWSAKAPMRTGRAFHTAGAIRDILYAAGGEEFVPNRIWGNTLFTEGIFEDSGNENTYCLGVGNRYLRGAGRSRAGTIQQRSVSTRTSPAPSSTSPLLMQSRTRTA